MKRLPLFLSGIFLAITLTRVAAFADQELKAGILGWLFSIALGMAVYTAAYWTRIPSTRKQAAAARLAGLLAPEQKLEQTQQPRLQNQQKLLKPRAGGAEPGAEPAETKTKPAETSSFQCPICSTIWPDAKSYGGHMSHHRNGHVKNVKEKLS